MSKRSGYLGLRPTLCDQAYGVIPALGPLCRTGASHSVTRTRRRGYSRLRHQPMPPSPPREIWIGLRQNKRVLLDVRN